VTAQEVGDNSTTNIQSRAASSLLTDRLQSSSRPTARAPSSDIAQEKTTRIRWDRTMEAWATHDEVTASTSVRVQP